MARNRAYKKIIIAGVVKAPPAKKNEPGRKFIVCVYMILYIGPYTKGISASDTPNKELIFPEKKESSLNKSEKYERSCRRYLFHTTIRESWIHCIPPLILCNIIIIQTQQGFFKKVSFLCFHFIANAA